MKTLIAILALGIMGSVGWGQVILNPTWSAPCPGCVQPCNDAHGNWCYSGGVPIVGPPIDDTVTIEGSAIYCHEENIESCLLGLSKRVHGASFKLPNVTIPIEIKYCDQVSGKDAGAECVQRPMKIAPKRGTVIHYKASDIKPGESCPSGMHWAQGNSAEDSIPRDKQGNVLTPPNGISGSGSWTDYDYYFCERNRK